MRDQARWYDSVYGRRLVVITLGRLGDPAAVPALASVLWTGPAWFRVRAIEALAEIGHASAIRPLVPLLGDSRRVDGQRIRERVARGLGELGEEEMADSVLRALSGDCSRLKSLGTEYRTEIITTLAGALTGTSSIRVVSAVAPDREWHVPYKGGDELRRNAAAALGQLVDPRAVPALARPSATPSLPSPTPQTR